MTDFIITVRPTCAKPGTWGYAEATCSHCGAQSEKTVAFRAYYEAGDGDGGEVECATQSNVCADCLRAALSAIESSSRGTTISKISNALDKIRRSIDSAADELNLDQCVDVYEELGEEILGRLDAVRGELTSGRKRP